MMSGDVICIGQKDRKWTLRNEVGRLVLVLCRSSRDFDLVLVDGRLMELWAAIEHVVLARAQ